MAGYLQPVYTRIVLFIRWEHTSRVENRILREPLPGVQQLRWEGELNARL